MSWYLEVLKKYVVFDGRARRTEYWMFTLFSLLISIALALVDAYSGLNKATNGISPLNTIYTLAVFLPTIAVTIRRLHDTGRSGAWILIVFVPCIGGIMLLVWMATEGERGRNQYGSDPKGRTSRSDEDDDDDDYPSRASGARR